MSDTPTAKQIFRKLILPIGVGGLAGFAGAFTFLRLTGGESGLGLTPSQEIAGLVGMLYVLIALSVMLGVAMPNAGARILNVEDAEELREQKKQLTYSGAGMVSLGLALVVLALSGAGLPIAPATGAILAIALVLVATIATVVMKRFTDELQASLSRDAIVTAFYLMFFIGGGWAALAHAELLASPQPLDWLTMFACTLLVGAFWQVGRRGLLMRGPN